MKKPNFPKPYTFRSRVICALLLVCLAATMISFMCAYAVSRVNVQNELSAAQVDVAITLLAMQQKTSLPVETLAQMTSSGDVSVTEVDPEHSGLTDDQLQQLNERLMLTVTKNFTDMPITYVLLEDGMVRISPDVHVNIFARTGLRFAMAGATFTLVFALLGLLSAQAFSRPVSQMTAATKRLAKGDFSVRLPDDKPGELGELLRSFNSMADDLSRTAYLQKDFISSISHEFKTPIASIKGYARLLQMPGLDEESRNEYVNMIAGESERLSHMSQTLLRLTSLEEQMMPATVTTFRLDEQLREVLVQLAPAWENRKIDWQLELSPVTIASDEELLRQVWVNLIQNAVKFSDEGGIIEIHVYAAGDAVVEVIDHGIGMDEATMARIYDRFYQADTSRSREGVGLGLCLVKRIVDILGGTIRVHSKPGEGSTFRVRLPMEHTGEEKPHYGQ